MDRQETPAAPRHGVLVRARTDRFEAPLEFLDAWFNIVLSGQDTAGAACAIETSRHLRGGPPLHVHPDQDEWFFVREGEFDMVVGDARHHLSAGDSLLAPRGVPHAFASTTETARMLVTFFPAGQMEDFFRAAASAVKPSPPEMAAIFARHGMKVVGAPLDISAQDATDRGTDRL